MEKIMKSYQLFLSMVSLSTGITVLAKPMTATLLLSERVSMAELATNVLDPNSERYQQYYTPEEIREISGPIDEDYENLIDTLKSVGFEIARESTTHLAITIRGDKTLFERVFRTKIEFTGMAHTNTIRPFVPLTMPLIESISGLDNTMKLKPRYRKYQTLEDNEFTGAPGISPANIRKIYGIKPLYDQGLSGKGQHVGIATYMNYSRDDIVEYYQLIGLRPGPTVDTVSFNGQAPYDAGSAGETELDAEVSGMIAPGSKIHIFTSAENSEEGELALFTAVLDDNRCKVVNYSWGSCERYVRQSHKPDMDRVFNRAVAQGVNLLVASGDNGSDGCGDGTVNADWPAAHPSLVAVGGTSVYINTDGSKIEKGWSGSGGGISSLYKLPSWQSALKAPFVRRSFPDIAFNADPATGQGIWVRPSLSGRPTWMQVGGTSMAAPQWVGYLALVNEARAKKGKKAIGFLNPLIYKASAQERAQIFTDITKGKNGVYSAGTGWDAVTGWGSMRGEAMLNFLLAK